MEKQYYDLIVSLIKNHTKYAGHESLLEEIAEDVYKHSQVVFSSVSNEDVITAYVNKVISNSIVTVSKKHNLNVRPRHTASSILSALEATKAEPVMIKEEPKSVEKIVEPVSQPVEITDELSENDLDEIVDLVEEDEIVESVEQPVEDEEDLVVQEESFDIDETEEDLSVNINDSDDSQETLISDEDKSLVEEIKPDMTLVDKMINGVGHEPKTLDSEVVIETPPSLDVEAEEEFEVLDDLSVIDEVEDVLAGEDDSVMEVVDLDIQDETPSEETDVVTFAKDVAEQVVADEFLGAPDEDEDSLIVDENFVLPELDESSDDVVEEEILIESDELNVEPQDEYELNDTEPVEILETESFDETVVDENVLSEEIEVFEEDLPEEILETDGLIIDESMELVEQNLDSEIDDELEVELPELDLVDEAVIEEINEESKAVEKDNSINTVYSRFAYEPNCENDAYSSEEVLSLLKEYDTKHPEHKVLEICELKYSKNLSVAEIANELEFEVSEVLEILNEVIDIVKD